MIKKSQVIIACALILLATKTRFSINDGIDDFNAGAGDPDLGGSRGVPPPAEHVLPQLEVLGHHNKVLEEALVPTIL